MGAHLRNGKNISFEQQAAAAAAARDQQRAEQLHAEQKRTEEQQLAEQYYTGQQYLDQYPSFQLVTPANEATSVTTSGQQLGVLQETPWLPPTKGELPRGSITSERPTPAHQSGPESPSAQNGSLYNPSPAALERLCRAREQFTPVDGFQRAGSADGRTSSLRPPPRSNSFGSQLQGSVNSSGLDQIHPRPLTSGETGLPGHSTRVTATPSQRNGVNHSRSEPAGSPRDDGSSTTAQPSGNNIGRFPRPMAAFRECKRAGQPTDDAIGTYPSDLVSGCPGKTTWDPAHARDIGRLDRKRGVSPLRPRLPGAYYASPGNGPIDVPYDQSIPPEPSPPTEITPAKQSDGDTQMRPALVQQHQAQPAQLPPLLRQIAPPAPYQTHPYYGQTYYANQPRQHQLEYQPHEQYLPPRGGHQYNKPQQHSGPQYHRPYQRNRENTWRRRYDPMANMMQMGTFFMRAERTLSRMQRLRYRGRSYRGNLGNNQAPPPPGNFQ
ncbi:hypothetical protein PCANC_14634 [Puccinia coronata f. sp. avenae]|uniref:Uncharacterized protein n=1 Tax=Puccinia coronata f. sp. avenae TaxID=200324 RepID=A0A2N5SV69_9BASI|nr:hypothetical protein PCANC_14634 [Puccinia coronata f. sp. avenae]